jgi:hypothetical protein
VEECPAGATPACSILETRTLRPVSPGSLPIVAGRFAGPDW